MYLIIFPKVQRSINSNGGLFLKDGNFFCTFSNNTTRAVCVFSKTEGRGVLRDFKTSGVIRKKKNTMLEWYLIGKYPRVRVETSRYFRCGVFSVVHPSLVVFSVVLNTYT